MNKENYHKLLQKFYAGETSISEEKELKKSGYLSTEDSFYFEILKQEKQEKSNLNFNEFIALAQNEKDDTPIAIKSSNYKWVWLAASLILLFSVGSLWFNNHENMLATSQNQIAAAEVYKKEKAAVLEENNYEQVELKKDVEEAQKIAKSKDILDDILPKKSRMKKRVIVRLVENSKPEKISKKTEYESGYVIINGQKITNEKDAVDVTKYSFQIIANNMNQSISQSDIVNTLNFED